MKSQSKFKNHAHGVQDSSNKNVHRASNQNDKERPSKSNSTKTNRKSNDDDIHRSKNQSQDRRTNPNLRNNRNRQNNGRSTSDTASLFTSEASPDIISYWRRIKSNSDEVNWLKKEHFPLWFGCWSAAAHGALQTKDTLLKLLLVLPDIDINLPLQEDIAAVCVNVLKHIDQEKKDINESHMIQAESVFKTIEKRMIPKLEYVRDPDTIINLKIEIVFRDAVFNLISKLKNSSMHSRNMILLNGLPKIEAYCKSLESYTPQLTCKSVGIETNDEQILPDYLQWMRKPTLQWLLHGSWHNAPRLRNNYATTDEYTETLLRIWTSLTFYWGSAAVWPKCYCKQGGGQDACGQPLLRYCANDNGVACSTNGCNRPAAWRCHRFSNGHESICLACLRREQQLLVKSSTDIYDCVVEKDHVRPEGTVYHLSRLQSRKPPKINPNWRTCYRLTASALVAVIKINVTGERLEAHNEIMWAEIVASDMKQGVMEEWRQRQNGRLTIRLLSSSDCECFPEDSDMYLDNGSCLSIIDLRVFVPEVISILSTFSKASFASDMNSISFIEELLGCRKGPIPRFSDTSTYNPLHPRDIVIRRAISSSRITLLMELSIEKRNHIIQQVLDLPVVKTLSGAQLDAFASALYSPVHCTQGPPGTGKSYLGVCLVLALDIIRRQVGREVGPIVVLSYKNHALDEFLVDILQSMDRPRKGDLIRSGKPEREELMEYSEKSSPDEWDAKKVLSDYLLQLRKLGEIARNWKQCAMHLTLSSLGPFTGSSDSWTPLPRVSVDFTTGTYKSSKLTQNVMWAIAFICQLESEESLNHDLLVDCQDYSNLQDVHTSLIRDAEHWGWIYREYQCAFLLHRFMDGLSPPPRCEFKENSHQCFQIADAKRDSAYCSSHVCNSPSCKSLRNVKGSSDFCDQHQCRGKGLDRSRCVNEARKGTIYCDEHICYGCVDSNVMHPLVKAPNACKHHTCIACNNLALRLSKYCVDHACKQCMESGLQAQLICSNSEFCVMHKCNVKICSRLKLRGKECCAYHSCVHCMKRVSADNFDSHLCSDHKCIVNGCSYLKRKPQDPFCEYHTCRICLDCDATQKGMAKNEFPRNVCDNHLLCSHVHANGNFCIELTANLSTYCQKHQQNGKTEEDKPKDANSNNEGDGQCFGLTTKKNKRCGSKGINKNGSKWYCKDHRDQQEKNGDVDGDVPAIIYRPPKRNPVTNWENNIKADILDNSFCYKKCSVSTCGLWHYVPCSVDAWECSLHNTPREIVVLSTSVVENAIKEKSYPNSANFKVSVITNNITVGPAETKIPSAIELCSDQSHLYRHRDEDATLKDDSNALGEADERDYNNDDYEEEENCDALQHLREVDDIEGNFNDFEDESDHEDDGKDMLGYQDEEEDDFQSFDCSSEIYNWTWALSLAERYNSIAKILRYASYLLIELKHNCRGEVQKRRNTYVQSKAIAFKRARVIGATVVGASKRLDAIRAAEPFAIIVEEACEVMEPVLMSVLAVKSLKKLELVGDHRQLPAFIQSYWYNLESTQASIKTSLFERLVEGKPSKGHTNDVGPIIPFTVLDEQRRMRSEIADLTRIEYKDLVTIQDHPHTAIQRIGDVALKSLPRDSKKKVDADIVKKLNIFSAIRSLWQGEGREVPGVRNCVHFWNINGGIESKATVGLSTCNMVEVDAIVELCKWLIVVCGVLPSSISIITPYKGQKTALIKGLREKRLLPPPSQDHSLSSDAITISTVDRYQGDENDIVIFSLVRTRPGNRFVELKNRFIVALSRARLGCYVVGAVSAITPSSTGGVVNSRNSKSLEHWRRFIENLQPHPLGEESDSGTEQKEAQLAISANRISTTLPIVCPAHREYCIEITSSKELSQLNSMPSKWTSLCKGNCQIKLERCGHPCAMPCHFNNNPHTHNSNCRVMHTRPCQQHSKEYLQCGLIKLTTENNTVQKYLKNYECDFRVVVKRKECTHEVTLKCFHKTLYLQNELNFKEVCKEAVTDYIHPRCGHKFTSMTCHEKRQHELKSPDCQQIVRCLKKCGCEIKLNCFESDSSPSLTSQCENIVAFKRPRCSHMSNIACYKKKVLTAVWNHNNGVSATVLGKDDVRVDEDVKYGHSESQVFQDIPSCSLLVTYLRSCGHELRNVQCSQAFRYASKQEKSPACEDIVNAYCPFCKNTINVPCHLKQFLETWNPLANIGGIRRNDKGAIIMYEYMISKLQATFSLPANEAAINVLNSCCKATIAIQRSCHPSHTTKLPCFRLISILTKKISLPDCDVPVTRRLVCGHDDLVRCYLQREVPPPCMVPVNEVYNYSCGIHFERPENCHQLTLFKQKKPPCENQVVCKLDRCQHNILGPCHKRAEIEKESRPFIALVDNIVTAKVRYGFASEYDNNCDSIVSFQRLCGHIITNVRCSDAFKWARKEKQPPVCECEVKVTHPVCRHAITTICYVKDAMEEWIPWESVATNQKPRVEYMAGSNISEFYEQKEGNVTIPTKMSKYEKDVICNEEILVRRLCGHKMMTTCSKAYMHEFGLCAEVVELKCNEGHRRQVACCEESKERYTPCRVEVTRLCTLCSVNKTITECCKTTSQCNQEVSCILPSCGHAVRWTCGTDTDPRSDSRYSCRQCTVAAYETALENMDYISIHDLSQLHELGKQNLEATLKSVYPSGYELVGGGHDDSNMRERHIQDRKHILRAIIDNLKDQKILCDGVVQVPPDIGSGNLQGYKAVFSSNGFDPRRTVYGRGVTCYPLNQDSIAKVCKPIAEGGQEGSALVGFIKFHIGLLFQHQELNDGTPPFAKNASDKGEKRANKLVQEKVQAGYDSIRMVDETDVSQIISWYPGAVISFGVVTVKPTKACSLCFDHFFAGDYYSCSKDHILCWSCFDDYIGDALQPGAVPRCMDKNGNIKCVSCLEICELDTISRAGKKEVFDKCLALKMKVNIEKEVAAALETEREKMKAEIEQIEKIEDVDKRNGHLARREIVNDILTLKCPRCQSAFQDFSGCFALTCHLKTCGAGFCAWCLQDCGTDAHTHVAGCKENRCNREVFGSEEIFETHHNERKGRLINQKLQLLNDNAFEFAYKLLLKDIEGTRVQIGQRKVQTKEETAETNGMLGNIRRWFG